ncbi:MAG: hypothetical protein WC759_01345 [Candidatus Micrarchaeia archaeon]|jgi:hypothetical protein
MPLKVVSQAEAGAAAPEQKDRTAEQVAANIAASAKRTGANASATVADWQNMTPKDKAIRDRTQDLASSMMQIVDASPASQEGKAQAVAATMLFETRNKNGAKNPLYGDAEAYYNSLTQIPGLGDVLGQRLQIDKELFNYVTDISAIEGKIKPEFAEQLKQKNAEELEKVKKGELSYLQYRQNADTVLSQQVHSDFSFKAASSFPSGFSASASNVPRVVGTSLSIGSQLASAALGGQIAAAREKAGGAPAGPTLGKSEAEEGGFLMTGGEASAAPKSTREDAGQLDVRLAHLAAAALMDEKPLAEQEARTDNLVASNLVSDVVARRKGKDNWEA